MQFKKTGIKLLIFAVLGLFLYAYIPVTSYIKIAVLTFLFGAGFFLVFFDGYKYMD